MWIVALALRRPYTFVVMALLIIILTPITILRTPVDIFPEINIPVVSVVWNYDGLSPSEMADRIVSNSERGFTVTVNDIEHQESQSLHGKAVIKIFFRPYVNISMAMTQVTAMCQTVLRGLPPGTTPPLVITYTASTTPIVQLGLSSKTLPEQQLFDLGNNFLRTQLTTVQGAGTPYPYGGKPRQIQVDLDTAKLQAYGLSPADIVNAVAAQNLILPAGTTKIGPTEYNVEMNGTPHTIAELNDLPVKTTNSSTLYLRDVAHVRDGFAPQTNIVRQDGVRGVLMSMYKLGGSSTLTVVNAIKAIVARWRRRSAADRELTIKALFDQSLFVRASIQGVLREGLTAACLTAVMILLFLGDWRPTMIIAISIPLSIFVSVILLSALGETINIMTLGGLALAVGISGGRRDGGNRKHRAQSRHGQGDEAGHSGWRAADCRAGVRFDPVHLHCVCADVLSGRSREVSFRAAGGSGVLRHAGVVSAFANADPDHGDVHHARARAPRGRDRRTFLAKFQRKFERGFEKFRGGYQQLLETHAGTPRNCSPSAS